MERAMLTEKEYEIALSYAHDDKKIAELLRVELENIFSDGFFMDVSRTEELADAAIFEEKLRDIFQRSRYWIILYSKNYEKGKFTNVEKEGILKLSSGKRSHLFIININDNEIIKAFPDANEYIPLYVQNQDDGEWEIDVNVHSQIYDIVHNYIKKRMIRKIICGSNKAGEFALNVHTTYDHGNDFKWRMDYDWNMSGKAFISSGGRSVKEGCTWQELWDYLEKDFIWIKDNLDSNVRRKICLNCQLSVSYKLGQIYGDLGQGSGNRNLELRSKNRVMDIVFPLEKKIDYDITGFDFCTKCEGNDTKSKDFVCIISIKPRIAGDILGTVKSYLESQGKKYCGIYLFQKRTMISDSTTLENMAEYIREKMCQCQKECGSGYTVHLFPDTAAPLMFVLGARTIVSGKIQLYEYKMEENSYEMSLVR